MENENENKNTCAAPNASGIYARFFRAFAKIPYNGDKEELRRSLISQYSAGRTDSLRQLRPYEYNALCIAVEAIVGDRARAELRRQRSICLHLMQSLGVNTADWARVNAFCSEPRIAGKPFAHITTPELRRLALKLRGIQRAGGLRPYEASQPAKGLSGIVICRHAEA